MKTPSGLPMNYGAESATARLWRDKAEIREQERNEARAQTKIAEEKVAILTAENHRLLSENARLRAKISANPVEAEAETEMQMEALRGALIPLLVA
jgi:regulator of replication initiation timing